MNCINAVCLDIENACNIRSNFFNLAKYYLITFIFLHILTAKSLTTKILMFVYHWITILLYKKTYTKEAITSLRLLNLLLPFKLSAIWTNSVLRREAIGSLRLLNLFIALINLSAIWTSPVLCREPMRVRLFYLLTCIDLEPCWFHQSCCVGSRVPARPWVSPSTHCLTRIQPTSWTKSPPNIWRNSPSLAPRSVNNLPSIAGSRPPASKTGQANEWDDHDLCCSK